VWTGIVERAVAFDNKIACTKTVRIPSEFSTGFREV
jgi:hypothetical protein